MRFALGNLSYLKRNKRLLPTIRFSSIAVTLKSHRARIALTSESGVPSIAAHHDGTSAMPLQTVGLLKAASHLYTELPADVVLIVTETPLDLDQVYNQLVGCRVLVSPRADCRPDRDRAGFR